MTIYRRWAGTAVLAAAAATALAACSSASSTGSSSAAASPSSPASAAASPGTTAATGSPITIFAITAVNTPTGSFPGLVAAMNAAARGINAAGGINGHPLAVQSCNGQADPNQEVTCARQAVASKAAAVVAPLFVANPSGDLQVLQNGGMADLAGAAASPAELASPIAFPLDAGPYTPEACLQLVKAKLASKLATVSTAIAAAEGNVGLIAKTAPALGITISTNVTLPPTAPDVTSQMQQIANSGANGVVMFAVPNQAAQVLASSAQLGQKMTFCTADGLLPAAELSTLGPAAGNLYIASTMPPLSAAGSNPAVAHFISDLKAEAAAGDSAAVLNAGTYSSTSMRAWAGVEAFAQIAKTISGPVTKASFLAAVRQATDVTTGIFPAINFTKPVGGAQSPSLYNATVQLLKWNVSTKEFVSTNITYDAAK